LHQGIKRRRRAGSESSGNHPILRDPDSDFQPLEKVGFLNLTYLNIFQINKPERIVEPVNTFELQIEEIEIEVVTEDESSKGNDGQQGEPRIAGNPGQSGEPGPAGVKGHKGNDGQQGEPRIAGTPEQSGEPGPAGVKGHKGNDGQQGEPRIGPLGHPEQVGNVGDTGPLGQPGNPGATGKTGAKGERGNPDPNGPQGLQGNTGPSGPPGNEGARGSPGQQGLQGPIGKKGEQGLQGLFQIDAEPVNVSEGGERNSESEFADSDSEHGDVPNKKPYKPTSAPKRFSRRLQKRDFRQALSSLPTWE
jgi:hypothetical protein